MNYIDTCNAIYEDADKKKADIDKTANELVVKLDKYKDVPLVKTLLEMERKKLNEMFGYMFGYLFTTYDVVAYVTWLYEKCFIEGGEYFGDVVSCVRRGGHCHTFYLKDSEELPYDAYHNSVASAEHMIELINKY